MALREKILDELLAALPHFSTEVCGIISGHVTKLECQCHATGRTNPDAILTTTCNIIRCQGCGELNACQHCVQTICHCGPRCFGCTQNITSSLSDCVSCDNQTCPACRSGECQDCGTKVCEIVKCRCLNQICSNCKENCLICGIDFCLKCLRFCSSCNQSCCDHCRMRNVMCSTCSPAAGPRGLTGHCGFFGVQGSTP